MRQHGSPDYAIFRQLAAHEERRSGEFNAECSFGYKGQLLDPARPWLGLYASEAENKVLVIGLATRGPAKEAGVETGDIVLAVAGRAVGTLASFFRRIWALGEAGVDVPLTIHRAGRTFELRITSSDRNRFLKVPRLH